MAFLIESVFSGPDLSRLSVGAGWLGYSFSAVQIWASTCKAGSPTIRLKAKLRSMNPSPARFADRCTWSAPELARYLGLTMINPD